MGQAELCHTLHLKPNHMYICTTFSPQGFKANNLIIGESGLTQAINYAYLQSSAEIQGLTPSLQGMASWLSRRFKAKHASSPPHLRAAYGSWAANQTRAIIVTIVSRLHTRRILNLHEVIARLKSRHRVVAHVQVMEHLSFAAQVNRGF